MAIRYYTDDTTYKFKNRRIINAWLKEVAHTEGYDIADINIIFCSSQRHIAMNREFMQHDYFTDILTFDQSDLEDGYIAGELYIDVETVADNASQYDTSSSPLREMHRVVVHGVLHLCGQGDKSPEEAKAMREKEDRALSILSI